MPKQGSDAREAVRDLISSIRKVFKKYHKSVRRRSWNAVSSSAGDRIIKGLINDPKKPTPGLPRLLTFKEWMQDNG